MQDIQPEKRELSKRELVLLFPKLLVAAGDISVKGGDHLIFAPFNLTTSKYMLMYHLWISNERLKMTELKDLLRRSSSHLTQIVDTLEKQDLVRRVPSSTDRRVNLIEITEDGISTIEKVEEFFQQQMLDYMSDYNDKELKTAVKIIFQFINDTGGLLGMEVPTSPLAFQKCCYKGKQHRFAAGNTEITKKNL